jgi:xanthine dehydrogenase small subunit
MRMHKLVSLHLIPELYAIKKKKVASKTLVSVGARVSLTELRDALRNTIPEFARFLDIFASPQIKNSATLVGNVGNASPIADTPPFLLVCGAVLTIIGPQGKRLVPIESFYKAYRKTALKSGDAIAEIHFEIPAKAESLALYKVSQRKDLDISTVNAAFRVQWTDSKKRKISSVRIAYGGVAAVPIRLFKTEKSLQSSELSVDTIARAATILHSEMTPIGDLRGTSAFRRVLVENLFKRFFDEHSSIEAEAK